MKRIHWMGWMMRSQRTLLPFLDCRGSISMLQSHFCIYYPIYCCIYCCISFNICYCICYCVYNCICHCICFCRGLVSSYIFTNIIVFFTNMLLIHQSWFRCRRIPVEESKRKRDRVECSRDSCQEKEKELFNLRS